MIWIVGCVCLAVGFWLGFGMCAVLSMNRGDDDHG